MTTPFKALRRSSAAWLAICAFAAASFAGPAQAEEDLRIIGEDKAFTVETPDGPLTITRQMTGCAKNKGWLQPMVPVAGVTPVGEVEVLEAMNDAEVMLIDMRELDWYVDSTIPTSVNIPYTEVAQRLDEFGCEKGADGWDCAAAKTVLAFCNGPVCPQSPTAIKAMDREGFPMSKVLYYRGGMLAWDALGFTTIEGEM